MKVAETSGKGVVFFSHKSHYLLSDAFMGVVKMWKIVKTDTAE